MQRLSLSFGRLSISIEDSHEQGASSRQASAAAAGSEAGASGASPAASEAVAARVAARGAAAAAAFRAEQEPRGAPAAGPRERRDGAAGSARRGDDEASTVRREVVRPVRDGSRRVSYYVVWSAPDVPHLVGVHHCSWPTLAALLPGGYLVGSGVLDCKRFDDEANAVAYFFDRNHTAHSCSVFERSDQ